MHKMTAPITFTARTGAQACSTQRPLQVTVLVVVVGVLVVVVGVVCVFFMVVVQVWPHCFDTKFGHLRWPLVLLLSRNMENRWPVLHLLGLLQDDQADH